MIGMRTSWDGLRGALPRKRVMLIGGGVLIAAVAFVLLRPKADGVGINLDTAPRTQVSRGDLVVTLLQSGELAAKNSKSISNDTDTSCKILEIVEDGARVKKGDLLVELDVAELQDKLMSSEATTSQAEAQLKEAQEDIEIRELQYRTDLGSAELRLDLAKMELKKYTEAAYPLEVKETESALTLAKEELARALDKRDSTKRLVDKGFTNPQDLESAELEVTRRRLDVDTKQTKLAILKDYTYYRTLKEKENEIIKADAEVDRLKKSYTANLASKKVNLESKKTALDVARNRLERTREQVKMAKVFSEYDGLVFYPQQPSWRTDRTIEKGATVHPRQKILEFPDLSAWVIKTGVPESIIKKIEPGMKAYATIDALPGTILNAEVASISVVPDTKRWYDSDNKQYTVTLDVITTPRQELKPGMSTMVEVITQELKGVMKAPIQAVTTRDGVHYVYRIDGRKVTPVKVEIGANSENEIQFMSGVSPGEEILLYAPVKQETSPVLKQRPLSKTDRSAEASEEPNKADVKKKPAPGPEAGAPPAANGGAGNGETPKKRAPRREGGGAAAKPGAEG